MTRIVYSRKIVRSTKKYLTIGLLRDILISLIGAMTTNHHLVQEQENAIYDRIIKSNQFQTAKESVLKKVLQIADEADGNLHTRGGLSNVIKGAIIGFLDEHPEWSDNLGSETIEFSILRCLTRQVSQLREEIQETVAKIYLSREYAKKHYREITVPGSAGKQTVATSACGKYCDIRFCPFAYEFNYCFIFGDLKLDESGQTLRHENCSKFEEKINNHV